MLEIFFKLVSKFYLIFFLRRMSLYISYIPPCPIFALTSSSKELLGSTFSDVVPLNIARSFSKKLDSCPSYRRLISRNVFAISRLVQAKRHHYVSSSWHPSRLISRRYAPLCPFLTRAHSILTLFNVHILWNKVRLREHVCSDILKHVALPRVLLFNHFLSTANVLDTKFRTIYEIVIYMSYTLQIVAERFMQFNFCFWGFRILTHV